MMASPSFLVCVVMAFWLFRKFWSLCKHQELHRAGHVVQPVPLVKAPDQRLGFMSRHQLKQLDEVCAMMRHELETPLFMRVSDNRMIPKREVQALKQSEVCGTATILALNLYQESAPQSAS